MRLSTLPERDPERAVRVIHAALEAGVTFLDTAHAYCLDADDVGHNERIIARALQAWGGSRAGITVATKGGMRRPKGAWVPDGRAKHLRDDCEASRRALAVDTIDLYQLHVVDPKTPLETSVRALAKLRDQGLVREIGLCNVTVSQIEAARAIVPVASVQVSLSPFDDENLRNGVAEYCRDNGIPVLAYRPLGGADRVKRLAKDPVLVQVAKKHSATPEEVILAWLASSHPEPFASVIPLPGATRQETASSIGRAMTLGLGDDDRALLDERFSGRLLRVPRSERRPVKPRGEVVLVMGMPAAGKSGLAATLVQAGYERLNRDALGGSLSGLVPRLETLLANGDGRVVLDNTYPTRAARNEVIEAAWKHGAGVRCVWVNTAVPDAQINAIRRMIELHGSLPTPEEIKARAKSDPRFLLPDAQFRYERALEPPTLDEGFESIEVVEFRREPSEGNARAIILDAAAVAAEWRGVLDRQRARGWLVFVHAWRHSAPLPDLGSMELATCPHEAGPPGCWCRKPIPGSVIEFAMRRSVDLARSIVVGASSADRTLAERIGASFLSVGEFIDSRTEH